MASPASDDDGASAAAAVCCMCGDHGLPHELFQCNLCGHRTQHRHCSDLYPRAAGPYRSCNWCLREAGGGVGGASPVKAPPASATKRRSLNGEPRDDDGENEVDDCRGSRWCSRSAFSPDPEKPIKKPRKGRERAMQEKPVVATAAKKRREAPQTAAGGKQARFRVKVRRYKLLAEVISAS